MKFEKEYTKYWASTVDKSVDGTVIAGLSEADHFLCELDLEKHDRILDVGCSFGRMYEALTQYSDQIFGIDPDRYAVKKAREKSYIEVKEGVAENTGFDDGFFNFIFCWAVFDVVDHMPGLSEFNRILKNEGKLLVTGKNDQYYVDDSLAFKAEKNAYLKDFPNRFTNLASVLKNLNGLGFQLKNLYIFPRRGDFGLLNYSKFTDKSVDEFQGYEYLMVCQKTNGPVSPLESDNKLDEKFSITAFELAIKNGYENVEAMFTSIGVD